MATVNNISLSSRLQKSKRRATLKQQLVIGHLLENNGNMYRAMLAAGYSEASAKNPLQLTQSKNFQDLLEDILPDTELTETHRKLLYSKKLDHMTFPLGPKGEDDPNLSGAHPDENQIEAAGIPVERTTLTDNEIKAMLADVGGTVRRIVHGDTARHVYFWAPNDKTRHDALKLAYDLKGRIGKNVEPIAPNNTTYNTFIQQNNLNPNTPAAKSIIDTTLDALMEATKRKVADAG